MRLVFPATTLTAALALALGLAACSGSDDAGSYGTGTDASAWLPPSQVADAYGPSDTSSWSHPADASYGYADTSSPNPDGPDEPEPPPPTGDQFEAPGTNPFVVVAHDPLSTFGADVDTASYEIFTRDVGLHGVLPVPASVRLEEFVNYFRYHDTPPAWDAEHPFNVALEAAPSPFNPTTLLRIGVQGKVVPPEHRAPANLVFLVDVSGSMASANKLPLVKVLLRETLDVLAPTDTVAIVVYASSERVVLQPTPVSERATLLAAIDDLESGGSTAGQQGIALAYQLAEEAFIEGGINHVLLCTDGDFNVGMSSTDALVDYISDKRASGVTLTVVGFGAGNLNDAMMEAVSNAGDGVYAYLGDHDSTVAYAHTRMLGALYFIAKDMKLQVAFNPARVHAYRLLGYENNAIPDDEFTDDAVDAGEIGAGMAVTALYELVLAGDPIPEAADAPEPEDGAAYDGEDLPDFGEDDVVEVRLRYKPPGSTVEDPAIPVAFMLGAHRLHASLDDAGDDLRWAAAIAAFAEILKESPYADLANLALIAPIVDEQRDEDPDRSEFATLFTTARALLEADAE